MVLSLGLENLKNCFVLETSVKAVISFMSEPIFVSLINETLISPSKSTLNDLRVFFYLVKIVKYFWLGIIASTSESFADESITSSEANWVSL